MVLAESIAGSAFAWAAGGHPRAGARGRLTLPTFIVGFGLWALGFGRWALGFGLWAVGFGLWALGLHFHFHFAHASPWGPFTVGRAGETEARVPRCASL